MAKNSADTSELTVWTDPALEQESAKKVGNQARAEKGKTGKDAAVAQQKAESKAKEKAAKKARDKADKKAEKKAAKEAEEQAEKAAKKARKADKEARKAAEKARAKAAEALAEIEGAQENSPTSEVVLDVAAQDLGIAGLLGDDRAPESAEPAADLDRLSFRELLKAGPGFLLQDLDPASTPGVDSSKEEGTAALQAGVEEISELQERLYAQARGGGKARLLLVVQGMDTSGKGGIMRHVVGLMDPQGVDITAFKAPTAQEKAHPFLWRIRRALPKPGQIGVFDRSHYEDVLVVRVHNLVPSSTWARRYGQINTFEASQAKDGITMIKVMLHLSRQEQSERLAERLERPDKHWKFNPGDVDERARWEDYQVAYQAMLEKTSTDVAPWYVVPADRKWYARLAVQRLVLEHLRAMDPQWPAATFDVQEQRQRLAQS